MILYSTSTSRYLDVIEGPSLVFFRELRVASFDVMLEKVKTFWNERAAHRLSLPVWLLPKAKPLNNYKRLCLFYYYVLTLWASKTEISWTVFRNSLFVEMEQSMNIICTGHGATVVGRLLFSYIILYYGTVLKSHFPSLFPGGLLSRCFTTCLVFYHPFLTNCVCLAYHDCFVLFTDLIQLILSVKSWPHWRVSIIYRVQVLWCLSSIKLVSFGRACKLLACMRGVLSRREYRFF